MKRVDVSYVLLFDELGQNVLMVKNKGTGDSYYTLPGGAVEKGETLKEAAVREVKEETGLDVQVDGVFSVSEAFFEERGHHAIFFTFTGKIISGEINISFPEEIEEVTWMDVKQAEKYIHISSDIKGLIKDRNTVPYILRERDNF
ncbi:NUDIX hydrolase [Psychrobacillus lasiicapitis]|uniref:NUDIX hydrolase n=1 Tax=Psychrobacillus lasiicapitis TaxID=1636719 RepID=A0A544TAS4_9BACI|nr:NUDIX hydrolase [Psychrobacillus lasiicapitis]TQR14572.1 NUDIX hydrolase [Psychrobacillus lasiicapitis]GGA30267.1 DNA mismatch repair protein MutT [Psychrobacillus lasiicapitis]